MQNAKCGRIPRLIFHSAFCILHSALVVGCTWDQLNPFRPPTPPPPPLESFVVRNGGLLVPEQMPKDKSAEASLAGARELYRREDFTKARKLFHHLGNNEKNPPAVIQEALYYEAECLRLQGEYPKAADVYAQLLNKQTMTPYRDQAIQHMFEIANFWLQDTWDEVRESEERRDGKRWVVWPRFVSFDPRKPLIDREGRAIERLKEVAIYGARGPYADKALFLCGHVAWNNEDYNDADQHFTQLHMQYPESKYSPYATELAIKSKLMSTGGEVYDGKKVAEARKLVDDALRMPDVSEEKVLLMKKLLACINAHQAEKDFQMAEFWRRTGHAGSAYFYYEIVRRRYPGTNAYDRATKRMMEIRAKMQKEQADKLGPPPEVEGRPSELLQAPRRVQTMPEVTPMPRPVPGPQDAPMPRKVPGGAGGPPGPLPQGLGGN